MFTYYLAVTAISGRAGMSSGFVAERSRVRVQVEESEEISFPESTLCADSYFCIRSTLVLPQFTERIQVILEKVQVAVTAKHTDTLRTCMWLRIR